MSGVLKFVLFIVMSWVLDIFEKRFYCIVSHWQLLNFVANIYHKMLVMSSFIFL